MIRTAYNAGEIWSGALSRRENWTLILVIRGSWGISLAVAMLQLCLYSLAWPDRFFPFFFGVAEQEKCKKAVWECHPKEKTEKVVWPREISVYRDCASGSESEKPRIRTSIPFAQQLLTIA